MLQAAAYAPSFAAIERRLGALDQVVSDRPLTQAVDWRTLALERIGYRHASGRGVSEISFELRRGKWLALIGPSGAGKTTLVDLVVGLLEPQSGSIRVDHRPLDAPALPAWQTALAYVGQDGAVFNDSIRGNLLAFEGIGDAALWGVLETSGLAERVRAFSSGLDEPVGDRGSQLSGGERQRLVIARALLRRPSLLILDEATAALDAESEARLIEHLRAMEPRPAALVIAHRESTLAHCDSRLTIQHDPVRAKSAFAHETTSARINVPAPNLGGKE